MHIGNNAGANCRIEPPIDRRVAFGEFLSHDISPQRSDIHPGSLSIAATACLYDTLSLVFKSGATADANEPGNGPFGSISTVKWGIDSLISARAETALSLSPDAYLLLRTVLLTRLVLDVTNDLF